MDRTGYQVAMGRGVGLFERVAEDLFSDSRVRERDQAADRELIRDTVRRTHQRLARRRRLVARRS